MIGLGSDKKESNIMIMIKAKTSADIMLIEGRSRGTIQAQATSDKRQKADGRQIPN